MSATPDAATVRSTRFYSRAPGTESYPVFLVNNTLYKLDPHAISRCSLYLAELCKAPAPDNKKQESSDGHPIRLIDVEEHTFEVFLALAYGRPPRSDQWDKSSQSIPPLLSLLELGQYFQSPGTKELAMGLLRLRSPFIPAARLVHLGNHYGSKALFDLGFRRLVWAPLRQLTDQDADWMGFKVYVALARLKDAMQQHRLILAAEEPQFHVVEPSFGSFVRQDMPLHSPLCAKTEHCSEDWHAVWWNRMGRSLLDGRKSLTWSDCLERFRHSEFGRMHPECVSRMLHKVGEGYGNSHIFAMIDTTSAKLMADIAEDGDEEVAMDN